MTFTANPSVDRTFEVEELVRGALMRARSIRVDGGGKGVNVTRALAANGHRSVAVLPSGVIKPNRSELADASGCDVDRVNA